jgi:hypothetical protein
MNNPMHIFFLKKVLRCFKVNALKKDILKKKYLIVLEKRFLSLCKKFVCIWNKNFNFSRTKSLKNIQLITITNHVSQTMTLAYPKHISKRIFHTPKVISLQPIYKRYILKKNQTLYKIDLNESKLIVINSSKKSQLRRFFLHFVHLFFVFRLKWLRLLSSQKEGLSHINIQLEVSENEGEFKEERFCPIIEIVFFF